MIALPITPSVLAGAAPTLLPSAQALLVPLVIAALLIDGVIIAVWYMLGYLLNNSGVKQAARNEIYQLIGTAVIMLIILFSLAIFSGLFMSALSGSDLMSQSSISNMCSTISSNTGALTFTPIPLLTKSNGFGSILCTVVGSTSNDITYQIDYPLAASGVVLENLTYQTVVNLNSLFVVDSYLGFLSKFTPTFSICIINPIAPSSQCLAPAVPFLPETYPLLDIEFSAKPSAGIEMVYRAMSSMGILFTFATQSFIMQLTFVSLFLYIWPFLLFIGLIFRATIFTRKIGGLFIAVAIGAVFFYPLVFSIQYLTMGHGLGNVPVYSPSNVLSPLSNSISTIYGYNGLTSAPITHLPGSCNSFDGAFPFGIPSSCGTYTPNFYVLPSIASIAAVNGCWPPGAIGAGAVGAEAADSYVELVPFVSLGSIATALVGGLAANWPLLLVPYQCTPGEGVSVLFMIINAYGIYGMSAYLLPILNIMITVSAILGLSGILGGDTQLMGLAKFI